MGIAWQMRCVSIEEEVWKEVREAIYRPRSLDSEPPALMGTESAEYPHINAKIQAKKSAIRLDCAKFPPKEEDGGIATTAWYSDHAGTILPDFLLRCNFLLTMGDRFVGWVRINSSPASQPYEY
jgi:hypothetical protein